MNASKSASAYGAKPPLPPLAISAWLRYDVVSRALGQLKPTTVLEIGCGQGSFGARVAAIATYLGVEPDPISYEVARSRIEPLGGTVINGTHEDVPAGRQFDVVCSFEVLEHLEDDAGALAAWASFVKPGGHLLMSVPGFPARYGPMDENVGHFRRYSPDDLRERLTAAGLHCESITVYGWPVTYALEAVRNRIDAKRLNAAKERGATTEELTAASGRTFQPSKRSVGLAVQAATLPFRMLQRAQPRRGTGLVALASRPA